MKCNIENRTVFAYDNLAVMQGINSSCIDLIYLDPPFNKNRKFTAPLKSNAAGAGFDDIFKREELKDEWLQDIKEEKPYSELHEFLTTIKGIGKPYNFAYLAFMAIRLLECRRILKPTGSIYLHCDATMSHYLKILMDTIFGEENFRNEIVWCYHGPGSPRMRQFNRKHDTIFWYSKGKPWTFNVDDVRVPYKDPNQSLRRVMSPDGEFTPEQVEAQRAKGKIPETWWEMRIAARSKKEYVGYPTQKPIQLIERIITASSKKGDIILDPFCGCATACVAAERTERKWIGIDTSKQAIDLVLERLKKEVGEKGQQDWVRGPARVRARLRPQKRTDGPVADRDGKYVYIMSRSDTKRLKVGVSFDAEQRARNLHTGDPTRSRKVLFKHFTPHYREIEQAMHKQFHAENGEWVLGDLDEIKRAIKAWTPPRTRKPARRERRA